MANIASARKRWRQSLKRRERNRMHAGAARTRVTLARRLVTAGNAEEAEAAVKSALQALDVAAERGTIHNNNRDRRKSRLMKAYNLMVAEQTAAAAEAAAEQEEGAPPAAKSSTRKPKATSRAKTSAKKKPARG
ncbi:MAG: 30S ribosomal protein S20 [Dehalococcoidia bacterium]|nr:30S ribosomal protein S20 [Dehalococcoidia bacterium]